MHFNGGSGNFAYLRGRSDERLVPSLFFLALAVVPWHFRPAHRKVSALHIAEARETVT